MKNTIEAPMAGKVLEVMVKAGDTVDDGDELVLIESMKMEIPIIAEEYGRVTEVLVAPGSEIMAGDPMVITES